MTLEMLFDEVRSMDVTEPAAMDKVLSYYEDLDEEADEYIVMLSEKLKYESICWGQPWYQLSHCLTRPLNETHENYEECYRTGTFTVDEIQIVNDNWCKFVKEFKVPDKLICLARFRNRKRIVAKEQARIFVVAYLAQGLQRSLYQVNKFIVTHYGGINKGVFSKDEEKVMEICFNHKPKHAVVYATAVLARESRGIYMRLHEAFNGKPPKARTRWTLELALKFLKLLMKYTAKPLEELKDNKIGQEIWLKMEGDFNKPKHYLRYFWNTRLYSQLFIKCDFTLRRLQRKVFKVLRSSPYKVWTDIRWKEVVTKFPDGFTVNLLYTKSVCIAKGYSKHRKVPLQKLVDYALERTRANRRIRYRKKQFNTLKLNSDGDLEIVKYNKKLYVTYFQ